MDKKTTVYVWEKKNNANRHMFYINTMLCCVLSHVWLSVTLWSVALQAPLTMEFYRQEYWGEFPFPPPGDLSSPGIEQTSPALQWILYHYNSLLLLSHLGSPYIYIYYIWKNIYICIYKSKHTHTNHISDSNQKWCPQGSWGNINLDKSYLDGGI